MYENAKSVGTGSQIGLNQVHAGTINATPITQLLLDKLQMALEKARIIEDRSENLVSRLIGSKPKSVSESNQPLAPNGMMAELANKAVYINETLDRLNLLLTDLERVA